MLLRQKKPLILGSVALLLVSLGIGGWLKRGELRAWYYVHKLKNADGPDQEACIECVLGLPDSGVGQLIECLRGDDARACANVEAALLKLAGRTGDEDQRLQLAQRLAEAFPHCSPSGQPSVLSVEAFLISKSTNLSDALLSAAHSALVLAQSATEKEVLARALLLGSDLIARTSNESTVQVCRQLVHRCLHGETPEIRADAGQLAMHSRINLPNEVVALLDDPSPEVRRLAIVALAPSEETIATDDLLRWLHDPDPEVRQTCESALRSRTLSENQIRLGKTLTDPQPRVRLQVLDALRRCPDVEAGVWLRRLSHDSEPAVRVAAIRAALTQPSVRFADRLKQMCQSDPSPTVRQLAAHYRTIQQESRPEK